jgi:hypothetical protein
MEGATLFVEGEEELASQLPGWLRLDKVVGRDFPVICPAAWLGAGVAVERQKEDELTRPSVLRLTALLPLNETSHHEIKA